ncbi:hypothetical protein JVT61DRAFT_3923 [Boletus reticuloceps]|uniref:Uncharacterized protein n=1 Tax=Boletus reticuloceps TaxID=495285 RepID=A0A8I3A9I9_9AGAM|nr:hypothetical protein JVT61DRAFT_3923 [Boletus reticuloceps]
MPPSSDDAVCVLFRGISIPELLQLYAIDRPDDEEKVPDEFVPVEEAEWLVFCNTVAAQLESTADAGASSDEDDGNKGIQDAVLAQLQREVLSLQHSARWRRAEAGQARLPQPCAAHIELGPPEKSSTPTPTPILSEAEGLRGPNDDAGVISTASGAGSHLQVLRPPNRTGGLSAHQSSAEHLKCSPKRLQRIMNGVLAKQKSLVADLDVWSAAVTSTGWTGLMMRAASEQKWMHHLLESGGIWDKLRGFQRVAYFP